jgi:hypothetical protein
VVTPEKEPSPYAVDEPIANRPDVKRVTTLEVLWRKKEIVGEPELLNPKTGIPTPKLRMIPRMKRKENQNRKARVRALRSRLLSSNGLMSTVARYTFRRRVTAPEQLMEVCLGRASSEGE